MSVAIPIPLLQHLPDVNVTPAVGVDENMLVYDHDTARFVLRAPFAGLLATGATVGATAQAQAFTLGVVSPFIAPAADSTTAVQVRRADKATPVITVDTTNARVGIGTTAPGYLLHVNGTFSSGNINISNAETVPIISLNNAQPLSNAYIEFKNGGSAKWTTGLGVTAIADQYIIYSNTLSAVVIAALASGNVGIRDAAPAEALDVTGNANVTGVYKVDDVQVLSNRVIDARCADVANSGDATTDGLIDALRDAMIAHGLIAAA